MNFLLLGHRGYLGIGLNNYLGKNHNVIGWDKEEDLFKLTKEILMEKKIDCVLNFAIAADQRSTPFLIDTPTDKVNVEGTRHIAEILKGTDIGWIQMSTREIFGPIYTLKDVKKTKKGYRPKFLIHEEFPRKPQNSYGKSKLMGEYISESHPKSTVIRLTTGYTDFTHPLTNSWVLVLLKKVDAGDPVTLASKGLQFRDPLHIDDLGRLIELINEKAVWGEKFNAGGGPKNMITLREFVVAADPKIKIINGPHGDYGFAYDNRHAFKKTGWQPRERIREKIPVILQNVRQGISHPAGSKT